MIMTNTLTLKQTRACHSTIISSAQDADPSRLADVNAAPMHGEIAGPSLAPQRSGKNAVPSTLIQDENAGPTRLLPPPQGSSILPAVT